MPHHTRAAAQTLNHIWVTDEVLADAFNRFALVSHATRRYGSHVPGPLEARRRLARRQMGMAAIAPSEGPPPGSDFAALFGLGGRKASVEPEKSWRWEAPKTRHVLSGPGGLNSSSSLPAAGAWQWSHPPIPPVAQEQRLDMREEVKVDLKETTDPAEASRTSFQALLESAGSGTAVESSFMDVLLNFLKGPANKRAAMNFVRLAEWLDEREVDLSYTKAFDAIVIGKIERDGIRAAEIAKLLGLWCRKQEPNFHTRITSILDAYVRRYEGIPRSLLRSATKEVLSQASKIETEKSSKGETMELWLNILNDHPTMEDLPHDAKAWREVYAPVFKHYSPTDLVNHLGRLSWQNLAILLLRHRTPRLDREQANVATYSKNTRHIPVLPQGRIKEGDLTMDDLVKEYRALVKLQEQETPLQSIVGSNLGSMIKVLEILKEKGLPYITMCEEMFEIVDRSKSAWVIDEFYKCMRRSQNLQVSDKLLDMVIQRFLNEGDAYQVHRAALIFMHYPHLPLSRFPELPLKLIDSRLGRPHLVFRMLNRLPAVDKIPLESRTDQPFQALPDQHVQIVHLAAIKWAKCRRISDREAFRRVWECYRFLQDRHAPLNPLISRALVKSGVTRYLESQRRVPSTQMKYILDIVTKIEGQSQADFLDRAVFSIWRAMWNKNRAKIRLAHLQHRNTLRTDRVVGLGRSSSRWSRVKARKSRGLIRISRVAETVGEERNQRS